MKVRSVILIALDAFGGRVIGKTLLQKRLYFMSQLSNEDWGFHAHYYGPYSDLVASELVTLKVQGLVNEKSQYYGAISESGFEHKRYDYELTDSGREAIQWLKAQYRAEADKIAEAAHSVVAPGELDYMNLSIAAKSYFIVSQSAGTAPMTTHDIAAKAKALSWDIKPEQIAHACRFLSDLKLVNVG